MTDQPYYVLNVNPDGEDVLHRDPREVCNTQADEMPGREVIDQATAEVLQADGAVRLCRHCYGSEADE